jgi:hypothetical protein
MDLSVTDYEIRSNATTASSFTGPKPRSQVSRKGTARRNGKEMARKFITRAYYNGSFIFILLFRGLNATY